MTLHQYTIYEVPSGKILRHMVGVEGSYENLLYENEGVIDGIHSADFFYVADGVAVDRPSNPSVADKTSINADGLDAVTISGIPTGSIVMMKGHGIWVVDDDVFELTVDTPGEYVVVVDSFPCVRKEFIINAS